MRILLFLVFLNQSVIGLAEDGVDVPAAGAEAAVEAVEPADAGEPADIPEPAEIDPPAPEEISPPDSPISEEEEDVENAVIESPENDEPVGEPAETLEDGGMAGIDIPDAPADEITGDEISSEADDDEINGLPSQSYAPLFITFIFVVTVAVVGFQNRRKIIGYIVEGSRNSAQKRRNYQYSRLNAWY